MLTFAVVLSRRGRPLDPATLGQFEAAAVDVPFEADNSVSWVNDARTVWFAGWQPDRNHTETGWHVDGDGLTAVAGRVWPRRDGWKDAAPAPALLARRLQAVSLVGSVDDLAGVFMIASLSRTGSCAVAADVLGLGVLYWGQNDDVVVISTRASVAASVLAIASGTTPRRDAFGAGWLAYVGYAVGSSTGFDGITAVPAGAVVETDDRGEVQVRRSSTHPWRVDGDALAADPRCALAQVREEISTAIRSALRDPRTEGTVGLTGGKDSRLILAVLLADGVAGDLEYETYGKDDLPDVTIARQLAAAFGLRHGTNPSRHRGQRQWAQLRDAIGARRGTHREVMFRITVARTLGAHNVASPHLGRIAPPQTVLFSGLGGEVLRTNYPTTARFRSKEHAAGFAQQFGTAGILDADALDHYRNEMHALLFDTIDDHDSPQDVIDTYYLRQRFRRWPATTRELDPNARALPLHSLTGIRLAFAIGTENRHAEWIHRQLIHDTCDSLLGMPLTKGEWPPGDAGSLVEPAVYTDPVPSTPAPPGGRGPKRSEPRTFNRDSRAKQRDTDLEIMRRLFEPDAANPAFDLLDMQGVQRALDNFDDLPDPDQVQLYGALTAVMWLGHHELSLPPDLAISGGTES